MNLWESFASLLDVVLPRRARTARVAVAVPTDVPISVHAREERGVRIVSLMEYKEPLVEALIHALKYDRSVHAAKILAEILTDYLHGELSEAALFSTAKIFIVPIPLHATRERERGFNQVSCVLSQLPSELRGHIHDDVLVRVRPTAPQTRLPRAARLTNLEGAFAADPKKVAGTRVIVIDDVTTTGTTLSEAALTLKRAGAEVESLALARA